MNTEEIQAAYVANSRAAGDVLQSEFPELAHLATGGEFYFSTFKILDLARQLKRFQPKSVIELGTGVSTHIFDWWQRETGCSVTSVEESQQWYDKIRADLPDTKIDIVLTNKVFNAAECWYQWTTQGDRSCDLLYVDGPANTITADPTTPHVCNDALLIQAGVVLFDIRVTSVMHYKQKNPDAQFTAATHLHPHIDTSLIDPDIHHSIFVNRD